MDLSWSERLQQELDAPAPGADEPAGVWETLRQRLNPVEERPAASSDVISRELEDRSGRYFILKNRKARTYMRITPAQHALWRQMNGEKTVQDLVVEHFMSTGSFAHTMIAHFVEELRDQEMLVEAPVNTWSRLKEKLEERSFLSHLAAPAQFFLTQKLSLNRLDGFITALYRTGGWLFFTRPMQILYLVLSIGGFIAYTRIIENPDYQFFGPNFVRGIGLVWLASILPVVIHELGHALTVKHFGREVPRGGLMLYFGMPAAFVETTDIWMEPRRARLAVTWNGPYTGLILGGSLALVMYFFPAYPLNNFFFKMAWFAYLTVLMNVNPLLKYDGYYLLTDALEINSLRERSMEFVRSKLFQRLMEHRRFNRDEWILTIYGILSIIWTVYALRLIGYLWQTRVRAGIRTLFGVEASLLERFFSFMLAAAVVSLVVLIGLGLLRAVRTLVATYVNGGGLTRHRQLAIHLGLLAAAGGFGVPLLLAQWSIFMGFLAAVGAAALLWRFAAAYSGSLRGTALRIFAASIGAAGIAETLRLHLASLPLSGPLRWAAAGGVLLAGALLAWRRRGRWGGWPAFLGVAAGTAAGFGLQVFDFPTYFPLLVGLLILFGIWNTVSLLGGARGPATALVYTGSLLYIFGWVVEIPFISLPLTALLFLSAGAMHWTFAELPELSRDESNVSSQHTQEAVRLAVAAIVRRVIAQVFFESGRDGVTRFGKEFNRAMEEKRLRLGIAGNVFTDQEFEHRTVIELTELYGIAFDRLHAILCRDLGREMGRLSFNYGMDRLPWQNREVIMELILNRCAWASEVNRTPRDVQEKRMRFLKRVPLLSTLDNDELNRISGALRTEQFAAGDVLMQEGDPGDRFYIIERGQATFWQKDDSGREMQVDEKAAGQFFGEIALVSNAPRNATVRAATPLTVLTLSKADFDTLVSEFVQREDRDREIVRRSWLLRSMPIFDELEGHELEWLAVQMEAETILQGTVLFREGDPADRFYIVEDGELVISHMLNGREAEISRSRAGEYIGEIALIENKPRTATITAAVDTVVLSLAGEDFLDLVSSYASLGTSVSHTSSRRLSYLQEMARRTS